MVDSYETIDFLREQKIKLENATYIVNSHFLEQGQTLKEKIKNLIRLESQQSLKLKTWASQRNIV